jgi:hypothetical protein
MIHSARYNLEHYTRVPVALHNGECLDNIKALYLRIESLVVVVYNLNIFPLFIKNRFSLHIRTLSSCLTIQIVLTVPIFGLTGLSLSLLHRSMLYDRRITGTSSLFSLHAYPSCPTPSEGTYQESEWICVLTLAIYRNCALFSSVVNCLAA